MGTHIYRERGRHSFIGSTCDSLVAEGATGPFQTLGWKSTTVTPQLETTEMELLEALQVPLVEALVIVGDARILHLIREGWFWVWGLGVWGLGFEVWGLGFGV